MGKRIEMLRECRKLTREEVAEKAGISTKFLYEVERGKKGISAQTVLKLAQVLNTSCDYIMTGDDQTIKSTYDYNNCKMFTLKQQKIIEKILKLIWELSENK